MVTYQVELQHIQRGLHEDHNNLKQLLCGDKIVVDHHNSSIWRAKSDFQIDQKWLSHSYGRSPTPIECLSLFQTPPDGQGLTLIKSIQTKPCICSTLKIFLSHVEIKTLMHRFSSSNCLI